ncbi:MAG: hypothetical protein RMA76_43860 [Deltaproteobacteria bacterium]|jgi:hypothetical protein
MGRPAIVLCVAALFVPSCNLDTDRAAPPVDAPTQVGACGTTESVFPKLLAFVREDRFAPLREVLEARFLPSDANPQPDPSFRTIVDALLRLVKQLGLSDTAYVAHLAASEQVESQLGPLVVLALEFVDGRLDGQARYEALDAGAHFVRVCNPDHLLTAIEMLLRFESPSTGGPWIVALLDEVQLLLGDPMLDEFLTQFERNAEAGRPAIVNLIGQIMQFVADEDFAISRVETLLDSAVYPNVDASLETRIRRFVALLDEVTQPEANILVPLQGAMRCGNQHQAQRNAIIGFLYDLVFAERVGLETILEGADFLSSEAVVGELELLADVVFIVRTDLTLRDDLRELLVILLSTPDAEAIVPVLVELFEDEVVTELLEGVVTLLDGCGR